MGWNEKGLTLTHLLQEQVSIPMPTVIIKNGNRNGKIEYISLCECATVVLSKPLTVSWYATSTSRPLSHLTASKASGKNAHDKLSCHAASSSSSSWPLQTIKLLDRIKQESSKGNPMRLMLLLYWYCCFRRICERDGWDRRGVRSSLG
jgi:hypothetical protein